MRKTLRLFKRVFRLTLNNKILLLIFILAAALRFIGTSPGYPPYHPDEGITYSSADEMVKHNNLDPGRYDYPSTVPLTNFFFFKFFFIPISWLVFYITHSGQIADGLLHLPLGKDDYDRIFEFNILGQREIHALFWGRLVTAFFGLMVVFLTYLLAKIVFNKRTAIIAALLVAVNYREVINSHLGLPDIYNSFFLLLSLLMIFRILEKPTFKNYLISAISMALYFSTKFQVFTILPFGLVCLYITLKNFNLKDGIFNFFKKIFSPYSIFSILLAVFLVIILNPYLIKHWNEFLKVQTYQLSKYKSGIYSLILYPYIYLYHIGIGEFLSVSFIVGLMVALKRNFFKSQLLFLVISQFFFVFTYFSNGGYYTRNFVTITPLMLIFAAYLISLILEIKHKWFAIVLTTLILALFNWDNFINSVVVAKSYSEKWNFQVLSQWEQKSLPQSSKVAAHSSVPLLSDGVVRLSYDFDQAFSLEEFKEEGAQYSITNLDNASNDFYWWMTRSPEESIRYGWKPNEILESSYPALAVRELTAFSIYSVLNPWQAPDSDFIVSVIPNFKVADKEKMFSYLFTSDTNGWSKIGQFWYPPGDLKQTDQGLKIGGMSSFVERWSSPVISIDSWKGFIVDGEMMINNEPLKKKDGLLVVNFYKNLQDANGNTNKLQVRLSSRDGDFDKWVTKEVIGKVPAEAKFMTVNFQTYNQLAVVYLKNLNIYKADIEEDDHGFKLRPFYLDPDILFPFSQGGL